MMRLAYELMAEDIPWSQVADALVQRGCPSAIAADVAQVVEVHRKGAVRSAALRASAWACGWILLGLVITGCTYSAAGPGDRYIVTWGLFVFGGINLLRALWFLVSGRTPQS